MTTPYRNKNGIIIGTDQLLLNDREFNWSNLQDTLFGYEDPTTYTKATIGAVGLDQFSYFPCLVFQNKIWFCTQNSTVATDSTAAKVISYDGTTWTTYTKSDIGLDQNDLSIYLLQVYDNKLWIGTRNSTAATDGTGCTIVSYDGTTWTRYTKADIGGVNADQRLAGACVYNNKLYIGTYNTTAATDSSAAKLICFDSTGPTWSVITKATMGGVNADQWVGTGMAVYRSKLYIGTYNSTLATDSTASKLIVYDGSGWSTIVKSTMGATNTENGVGEYGAMAVKSGRLWIANSGTSPRILSFDGAGWTNTTSTYMGGGSNVSGFGLMTVYNGYLWYGTKDSTAAIDYTGAVFCRYDPFLHNPYTTTSYAKLLVYTKGFFSGGQTTDQQFTGMAIYDGYLWITVLNVTNATDNTSGKIIKFKIPCNQSQQVGCSLGF